MVKYVLSMKYTWYNTATTANQCPGQKLKSLHDNPPLFRLLTQHTELCVTPFYVVIVRRFYIVCDPVYLDKCLDDSCLLCSSGLL